MVLGLENIKGLDSIDINFGGLLQGIGQFFLIVLVAILVGGTIFIFLWKKKQKLTYNKRLFWFEEINGQMVPVGEDWATELTIPNTDIKVFYIKTKNLYLPRLVKRMGKDAYWCCIRNNREIVNFTMANLNKQMSEAGLDYDHTDMRYGYAELRELIKRNYRDKSTPWWKEYKELISISVILFIIILGGYFLISKIGTLIDKASMAVQYACSNAASGVQPAP